MIKEIKNWLKENDFDVKVKRGECFGYYVENNLVEIGKEKPEHLANYISYCKSLGFDCDLNWRTIAFLHELGHSETIFELSDFICFVDKIISEIIQGDCSTELGMKIRSAIYYRLPTEKAATKWAIDFINENYEEVEDLDFFFGE